MNLYIDCYPCLINNTLKTARLLNLNDEDAQSAMDETMRMLLNSGPSMTAPHITAAMYDFINTGLRSGDDICDPYREIKEQTNTTALRYFEHLVTMVDKSPHPMETAVKIAAAGNIIDFGAKDHGAIDIDYEIDNIENLTFGIFDFPALLEKMRTAKIVLYIGDNAGEIVFDKVFMYQLKKINPDVEVFFAVRDRPIINDVTMIDALQVRMEEAATVISSGSVYPGTVLEEATDEFRELFQTADCVIAKGQGNFETLSDNLQENLFFLLRVKCDVVGRVIGVETGSLVLWNRM